MAISEGQSAAGETDRDDDDLIDIDAEIERAEQEELSADDDEGAGQAAASIDEDGAAEDERTGGPEEEFEGEDPARRRNRKSAKDRIAELTFEREEARREAAAARAQAELTQQHLAQTNARLATLEESFQSQSDQDLDGEIETLAAGLKRAIEDGDSDAQVRLNQELVDKRTEKRVRSEQAKAAQRAAAQRPQQPAAPAGDQQAEPPLATDWKKRNAAWFMRPGHEAETRLAMRIDQHIAAEGISMNDPRYYEELDRRLKVQAPHLNVGATGGNMDDNDQEQPRRRRPANSPVGDARRGQKIKKGGDVRMTADELRVAKAFGLHNTEEGMKYFKQEIARKRRAQA